MILIEAFSRRSSVIEGRTKLAKLDFFLRYPVYFERALQIRRPHLLVSYDLREPDIESRMVRYRYGPWDPAYFALLGRLIGKGLVQPAPFSRGIGYRATDSGRAFASALRAEPIWIETAERADMLRRHFNLSGTTLTKFVYEHFPDVTRAFWGQPL